MKKFTKENVTVLHCNILSHVHNKILTILAYEGNRSLILGLI